MSLSDELQNIADELTGSGWRRKFPQEMTESEREQYQNATGTEKVAHIKWLLHEPIEDVTAPCGCTIGFRHNGNAVKTSDPYCAQYPRVHELERTA